MTATTIRFAFFVSALILSGGFVAGGCNIPIPPTDDNENDNAPAENDNGNGTEEFTLYVNAQVDAELDDTQGLDRIVEAFLQRNLVTTIYVTAEYALDDPWTIHDFFLQGFEIALHGYGSGEDLAGMSYEEQQNLLTQALQTLEGCQPCGTYKAVKGFRPQSFRQNEETYGVLDELELVHNSGFKTGELYIPGHQEDAVPYPVEGHNFHAVPVTVIEYDGRPIHLCDTAWAIDEAMTADQWAEALQIGLDQVSTQRVPLVVIFHGWYTGSTEHDDFWQAFIDFLNEVTARGGVFVTTQELVNLYTD